MFFKVMQRLRDRQASDDSGNVKGANLFMNLKVEISPGELIDKFTILEIKLARLTDEGKLQNVRREHHILSRVIEKKLPLHPEIQRLHAELRVVNEKIWQVEDDIRDHERRQDFGPSFIALARAVYFNNDKRAEIKRNINIMLDSVIVEEKSYSKY